MTCHPIIDHPHSQPGYWQLQFLENCFFTMSSAMFLAIVISCACMNTHVGAKHRLDNTHTVAACMCISVADAHVLLAHVLLDAHAHVLVLLISIDTAKVFP